MLEHIINFLTRLLTHFIEEMLQIHVDIIQPKPIDETQKPVKISEIKKMRLRWEPQIRAELQQRSILSPLTDWVTFFWEKITGNYTQINLHALDEVSRLDILKYIIECINNYDTLDKIDKIIFRRCLYYYIYYIRPPRSLLHIPCLNYSYFILPEKLTKESLIEFLEALDNKLTQYVDKPVSIVYKLYTPEEIQTYKNRVRGEIIPTLYKLIRYLKNT